MNNLPSAATFVRRGFSFIPPWSAEMIVALRCIYCGMEFGFTADHGGGFIDERTDGHAKECRIDRLKARIHDAESMLDRWRDAGGR